MAKISLHAYNREIENLIERGQTEEAIAHCKYILKQYPKHIDTYRLLGKTYLESQRYSEAADILQRVLSSIPDDFVSQLGMSIIREDEGNLDAAIWHMERAFEVQPANTAIQDELRRLYGRRDGVEPPKVRLTRGALVRMYSRGELFTQAIGEARAAIAEDPQRIDLEIILARMYYMAGMKVEATEVCSRLVSKLPFCYEANRILSEILPSTARAEDAKTFQQNLFAMNPYAALQSATVDQVPENAVQVERLDYVPSGDEESPQWARTAGVDFQGEKTETPDWLDSLPSLALASAPVSDEPEVPDEETIDFSSDVSKVEPSEIPEWMRAAGWTESAEDEGTEDTTESVFDLAGGDEENLAEAELPAWLKDMAPEDEEELLPEDEERLQLLDSILPPAPVPETKGAVTSEPDLDETPLVEEDEEKPEQKKDQIFGWTSDIDVVEDTTIFKTGRTGALPRWLEEELESGDEPGEQLSEEELPEWLRPLDSEEDHIQSETHAAQSEAGPVGVDEDASFAWLESLAEKQGADEGTLITSPDDRPETPPEWVTQGIEEEPETLAPEMQEQALETAAAEDGEAYFAEGIEQPEQLEPITSDPEVPDEAELETPGVITGPEELQSFEKILSTAALEEAPQAADLEGEMVEPEEDVVSDTEMLPTAPETQEAE
jgi:tetratricopeptide (TPR) repeat protein